MTVGDDLARLLRWADLGGIWRVIARRHDSVTVSLCQCDGGQEADRFSSTDSQLLAYLADRDTNAD